MRSKTFNIACASLVAAAAIGAGAYVVHRPDSTTDHATAAEAKTTAPVVPVTAAKVLQHDVPIVLEGLGTVTPINTATIRTQVQGTLDSVDFVEGKQVKRGDVLAKIDPRVYEAQVDQAEAALARDEASLKNARTNLARTQPLANRGFATQQLLDTQDSQVTQGEGTVALDKAALEAAQTQLSFATITAPFDGVTGERQVQPGDYVNIGTNLINVVPLPNVYVIANYKETQLTNVKRGQPVAVTVDTFSGQTLRGVVERIAPASGSQFALLPPDNATGNFTKVVQRIPVRIQFDKGQPLLARLLPGMSVVTRINTGEAVANGGK